MSAAENNEIEAFLNTENWAEIIKRVQLDRDQFSQFFDSRDSGIVLKGILHKFGEEKLARFIETIDGPIALSEEEEHFLDSLDNPEVFEKHEIGIAFRSALLPTLSPRLLLYGYKFRNLDLVSKEQKTQLFAEPDVEAALSPGLSLLDAPLSQNVYTATSSSAPVVTPVNDESITTFITRLVTHGITPYTVYKGVECISNIINGIIERNTPPAKRKLSLLYQEKRYIIAEAPSVDLLETFASSCNLEHQRAACLLDWLVNVALFKPFLFRGLETKLLKPSKDEYKSSQEGIKLKQVDWEEDLFDRWTSTRFTGMGQEEYEEKIDDIKQLAHLGPNEEMIEIANELGQAILFSGIAYASHN